MSKWSIRSIDVAVDTEEQSFHPLPEAEAKAAIEALNETELGGRTLRMLHVLLKPIEGLRSGDRS